MEIEILEKESNSIKFKVLGETHTILAILREELYEDSAVDFASYNVEHPLKDEAIFRLTTGRKDPVKALNEAVERIEDSISNFRDLLGKMEE